MRNNISLSTLRLFLRVAQTCSFSETARLEHVSQPALSRTIRLLEEQLEARLFDRDTRNVSLTAAGAQLQPIAERLIADYDLAFTDLAQTLSGERGRVTVGALPSVAAAFLPAVLARFRGERPQVEVRVEDNLSSPLLDLLQDRRIDFAVTIAPEQTGRLDFQPLFSDEFLLVMRKGDPLDAPTPISWAALEDLRFIAMDQASSVRRMTDVAFARANVVVRPLYECAHLSTVGGLIRAGLGVSALPASTLPLMGSPDLVARPLVQPSVSRSIGLVTLRSRSPSPPAAALIRSFRHQAVVGLGSAGDERKSA
ncbi:MAG TPA: LysR family transcriptional regulator [Caulobacteraceae bacterium]|jgi:LysR family carnitine catabolism transcriptional activator|nr:LysR family transcriptional regulator [Caulobacteraceae bacterium]